MEARVFGGYYHFEPMWEGNVETVKDIEGFKGRLEIKPLPGLFLDAEIFEDDELFGSDWLVGARVFLPFEISAIAQGKNPFAGSADNFKSRRTAFADRLVDNVIRDPHIQIRSQIERNTTTSQDTIASISFQTLFDAVIFVNNANAADPLEDGSAEHPFDVVQEGVDATASPAFDTMYVYAGIGPYYENVMVGHDVMMIGEGMPLGTDGGFGGGKAPVIQAPGVMLKPLAIFESQSIIKNGLISPLPALTVGGCGGANNVSVYGFEFAGAYPLCSPYPPNRSVVEVNNVRNFNFGYNTVRDGLVGLNLEYWSAGFNVNVHDNTFRNLGAGALAWSDASGTMNFDNNVFTRTAAGIGIISEGGLLQGRISGNRIGGGGLEPAICLLAPGAVSCLPFALPEGLPSIAGIGLLAVDGGALDYEVTGNFIQNNLLGIGVLSIGEDSWASANIANNTIEGGGLSPILQTLAGWTGWIDPMDPHLQFDSSIGGIGLIAIDGGSVEAAVMNNDVRQQLLGVGTLAWGKGSQISADFGGNLLRDNLLGINVLGIEYSRTRVNIFDNEVTGGGFGPIARAAGLSIPDAGLGGINVVAVNSRVYADIMYNEVGANLLGVSVVGFGPETKVETYIHDNQVSGGGSGLILGHLGATDVPEFGLTGITLASINGANMNEAWIGYNEVSDELLGINLLAISTDGSESFLKRVGVTDNVLHDNALGITALAWGKGSSVKELEIRRNMIEGGGVGDLLGLLGADVPDFGVAGVTVVAVDGGNAQDVQIRQNEVRGNLLGITVAGIENADLRNAVIRNNVVEDNLLGITALGIGTDANLGGLNIGGNEVSGDGLPVIGELLGADLPEMGLGGITLALIDEAKAKDFDIHNNLVADNVWGIGVLGINDTKAEGVVRGNEVENTLVGILALAADGSKMDIAIKNNTIANVLGGNYDDINWAINWLWDSQYPVSLPLNPPFGIVVMGDEAGAVNALLHNNTMTGNNIGAMIAGYMNSPNMNVTATDNWSDAPYYRVGGTINLMGGGNIPAGVIPYP